MTRQLLETLQTKDWDSQKPGQSGFQRMRWLQGLSDLIDRPVKNRLITSTNATAINLNGNVQSTGVGVGQLQPKRYAEFTVKARVTFNISANGSLYVYVYRTTGAIPANGAAPGGGDVIVGGDAFAGPATVAGQNMIGTFSFIDTGLDVTKQYRYYFAVKGTNGLVGNLVNNSQVLVLERA